MIQRGLEQRGVLMIPPAAGTDEESWELTMNRFSEALHDLVLTSTFHLLTDGDRITVVAQHSGERQEIVLNDIITQSFSVN